MDFWYGLLACWWACAVLRSLASQQTILQAHCNVGSTHSDSCGEHVCFPQPVCWVCLLFTRCCCCCARPAACLPCHGLPAACCCSCHCCCCCVETAPCYYHANEFSSRQLSTPQTRLSCIAATAAAASIMLRSGEQSWRLEGAAVPCRLQVQAVLDAAGLQHLLGQPPGKQDCVQKHTGGQAAVIVIPGAQQTL